MLTSIAAAGVESLTYTYDANKNPTSETRSGVMAAHTRLVPLNVAPLTSAKSRDDIVRANNGRFIGIASTYDP